MLTEIKGGPPIISKRFYNSGVYVLPTGVLEYDINAPIFQIEQSELKPSVIIGTSTHKLYSEDKRDLITDLISAERLILTESRESVVCSARSRIHNYYAERADPQSNNTILKPQSTKPVETYTRPIALRNQSYPPRMSDISMDWETPPSIPIHRRRQQGFHNGAGPGIRKTNVR